MRAAHGLSQRGGLRRGYHRGDRGDLIAARRGFGDLEDLPAQRADVFARVVVIGHPCSEVVGFGHGRYVVIDGFRAALGSVALAGDLLGAVGIGGDRDGPDALRLRGHLAVRDRHSLSQTPLKFKITRRRDQAVAPHDHGSPLPSGLGGYRRPRGVGHAPRGFDRSPFGVPRANQSDESSPVNRNCGTPSEASTRYARSRNLGDGKTLEAPRENDPDREFFAGKDFGKFGRSMNFNAFLPRHPRNDL